jgi:two-component system sensor histidine kinase DesK
VFSVFAAISAAYVRPARLAALGVVGAVVATVLFALALHLPALEWGWSVLVALLVSTAGMFTTNMRQREEQLALARDDARRYAVLAERERIARDLHDVLGHTLTLVAMKADLAKRLLDSDPESALREVDEIHAAARVSLGELRTALTGMRSTTLAVELVEARRALESAGVALESISPAEPLPPQVETALAYIIREASTNVLRHARAKYCRIHLWREGGTVKLTIQDNGHGGTPVEGQGLKGMRQRLAEFRGSLEVRGSSGFRLEVSVPLAPTGRDAVLPLLTTKQAAT